MTNLHATKPDDPGNGSVKKSGGLPNEGPARAGMVSYSPTCSKKQQTPQKPPKSTKEVQNDCSPSIGGDSWLLHWQFSHSFNHGGRHTQRFTLLLIVSRPEGGSERATVDFEAASESALSAMSSAMQQDGPWVANVGLPERLPVHFPCTLTLVISHGGYGVRAFCLQLACAPAASHGEEDGRVAQAPFFYHRQTHWVHGRRRQLVQVLLSRHPPHGHQNHQSHDRLQSHHNDDDDGHEVDGWTLERRIRVMFAAENASSIHFPSREDEIAEVGNWMKEKMVRSEWFPVPCTAAPSPDRQPTVGEDVLFIKRR
jgi:hypothetical protein